MLVFHIDSACRTEKGTKKAPRELSGSLFLYIYIMLSVVLVEESILYFESVICSNAVTCLIDIAVESAAL